MQGGPKSKLLHFVFAKYCSIFSPVNSKKFATRWHAHHIYCRYTTLENINIQKHTIFTDIYILQGNVAIQ